MVNETGYSLRVFVPSWPFLALTVLEGEFYIDATKQP